MYNCCTPIYTSSWNIWLIVTNRFTLLLEIFVWPLKGPLDDGWLHEEIQPSSSSGCGIICRGVQGYAVTTRCCQQSYTSNTPVHAWRIDPLVSPTRDDMGISSRICLWCLLLVCPPNLLNSVLLWTNKPTICWMESHSQANPLPSSP
jgi:hypothetical protein